MIFGVKSIKKMKNSPFDAPFAPLETAKKNFTGAYFLNDDIKPNRKFKWRPQLKCFNAFNPEIHLF